MARSKGNKITDMGQKVSTWFSNSDLVGTTENDIDVNINSKQEPIYENLRQNYKNKKRENTENHGIYFDDWVWVAIEDMGKEIGRGGISQLVNDVMAEYVKFHGYDEFKIKQQLEIRRELLKKDFK